MTAPEAVIGPSLNQGSPTPWRMGIDNLERAPFVLRDYLQAECGLGFPSPGASGAVESKISKPGLPLSVPVLSRA